MMSPFLQGAQAGSNIVGGMVDAYDKAHREKIQQQQNKAMQQQKASQFAQSLAIKQQQQQSQQALMLSQQHANEVNIKYPGLKSSNPAVQSSEMARYMNDKATGKTNPSPYHDAAVMQLINGQGQQLPQQGQQPGQQQLQSPFRPQPQPGQQAQPPQGQPQPQGQQAPSQFGQPQQDQPLLDAQGNRFKSRQTLGIDQVPAIMAQYAKQQQQTTGKPMNMEKHQQQVFGGTFPNSKLVKVPDIEARMIPKPNYKYDPNSDAGRLEHAEYQRVRQSMMGKVEEEKRNGIMRWNAEGRDLKDNNLAMAAGMGVDPLTATNFFSQGGTLPEMAQQTGSDLSKITPDYPLMGTVRSKMQNQKRMLLVQGVINNFNSTALSHYSRGNIPFTDLNPKQFYQSVVNSNPDQQSQLLAAKVLQTEAVGSRVAAIGGRMSLGMIQDMKRDISPKIRTYSKNLSSEVVRRANDYVNEVLEAAYNASASMESPQSLALSQSQSAVSPFAQSTLNMPGGQQGQQPFQGQQQQSTMPSSISTKQDARKWYNNLSQQQKQQLQMHGGN